MATSSEDRRDCRACNQSLPIALFASLRPSRSKPVICCMKCRIEKDLTKSTEKPWKKNRDASKLGPPRPDPSRKIDRWVAQLPDTGYELDDNQVTALRQDVEDCEFVQAFRANNNFIREDSSSASLSSAPQLGNEEDVGESQTENGDTVLESGLPENVVDEQAATSNEDHGDESSDDERDTHSLLSKASQASEGDERTSTGSLRLAPEEQEDTDLEEDDTASDERQSAPLSSVSSASSIPPDGSVGRQTRDIGMADLTARAMLSLFPYMGSRATVPYGDENASQPEELEEIQEILAALLVRMRSENPTQAPPRVPSQHWLDVIHMLAFVAFDETFPTNENDNQPTPQFMMNEADGSVSRWDGNDLSEIKENLSPDGQQWAQLHGNSVPHWMIPSAHEMVGYRGPQPLSQGRLLDNVNHSSNWKSTNG